MMARSRYAMIALGAAAFAIGLVQIAKSGMIPLKAMVGQYLLDISWSETVASGAPVKPWSWADVRPAGRLSAPRLGVSAVVLDSASGEAMAWGPGHVAGTAPLGGPGLAAIAGHRDSHLAFLADLRPGDLLMLETASGQTVRYRIGEAIVVDSTQWRLPQDFSGPGRLALSTCWPFGSQEESPMRFVLFADQLTG